MLDCQRPRFDIPDGVTYLNAAFMGPLSHYVSDAARSGLERKKHPWTIGPPDFFDPVDEVRDLFARLIGGDADGVAVIPAVSYGVAIAAANLPVSQGQTIVLLSEQFPSNVYAWSQLAQARKATVVTVPRPDDGDWTAAVLDAIEERCAVVAVETCHWTDGGMLDVTAVGRRTRDVGAALVVDGTQSVGAMPFDVNTVRPDFAIVATYKWLLAPYGSALMWCAPGRRDGRPLELSWITRRNASDFAHLVDYPTEMREGARRYDVGQTSDFVRIAALRAALQQTLDWGVPEIAAYTGRLTARIAEEGAGLGLGVAPPDTRAPHLLGLDLHGADPEAVAAALASAGVYVSVRGTSVRISPHVYNDDRDVARLLEALRTAL